MLNNSRNVKTPHRLGALSWACPNKKQKNSDQKSSYQLQGGETKKN